MSSSTATVAEGDGRSQGAEPEMGGGVRSPETPSAVLGFATDGALSFYLSVVRRYARRFVFMMFLVAIYAMITAARLFAFGLVIDAMLVHNGRPPEKAVLAVDSAAVWLLGDGAPLLSEYLRNAGTTAYLTFLISMTAVFAIAAICMALAYFFKEYLARYLVARIVVDIRQVLFTHLTAQSVSYFDRQRSGDIISRLTNDVNAVQISFRYFFETLVQQPITVVFALGLAYWASPLLFFCVVPLYGVLMLPLWRSRKKVHRHGKGSLEKLSLVTEAIQQLFGGIRVVKAFGMEKREQESFGARNAEFIHQTNQMNRAKLKARALQELLYNLGTAGVILGGVWLLASGGLEIVALVTFIGAMVQIYTPVKTFSRAWNQIQESRAGVDRVLEILREPVAVDDDDETKPFFSGDFERIKFDRVSFSYDQVASLGGVGAAKRPVVHEVGLEAKAGEVVALVGPSGAGKSTLVDLLARFYDPLEGRILIDGVDSSTFRRSSFIRSVGIVSQEPFLFNASIRENIQYARANATFEEIREAARVACAHEFILEQPDGYDTIIGDRGGKLSGGQRQRITIARAVLKNAPILILDEATSSLDSHSEKEVQRAMENLMQDRTTFVIAHRLSTIVGADQIVYLEEGRIVEHGRHEELLGKKGKYYHLWRSQKGEESYDEYAATEAESENTETGSDTESETATETATESVTEGRVRD